MGGLGGQEGSWGSDGVKGGCDFLQPFFETRERLNLIEEHGSNERFRKFVRKLEFDKIPCCNKLAKIFDGCAEGSNSLHIIVRVNV